MRVIDAEAKDVVPSGGEIRDERIVGVDDQRHARVEGADRSTPALGDRLELPVAVELVAKEVPERHHAGRDAPHQLRQRRLVDLEQSKVRFGCGEEGGGDPRCEVRARVVPGERVTSAEDACGHGGRRRLAVRR